MNHTLHNIPNALGFSISLIRISLDLNDFLRSKNHEIAGLFLRFFNRKKSLISRLLSDKNRKPKCVWYNWRLIGVAFSFLLIVGCGTTVTQDGLPPHFRGIDINKIPDPIPKPLPLNKHANPSSYRVLGHRYYVMRSGRGYSERGLASWYGYKFHRHNTSSGEPYDMFAMTAAHKTLPIPCYVRVTNLKTGTHVIVKVNDRGPFHANRIIDLSYVAAKKLGVAGHGTGFVQVDAIDTSRPYALPPLPRQIGAHPQLYVQAGAFSVARNAERLKQRLQTWNRAPVVVHYDRQHRPPMYQVRIGPMTSISAVDRLKLRLDKAGLSSMTVIETH